MATTSSASVLLPAAAALMVMMVSQFSARAAAAPPAQAPIGLPTNCSTTCGNVSVPYPFGFGPSHCYWPGLNLTCDTSYNDTPRLLLGDGTLRVSDIFLEDATVRVMRIGPIINATGDFTSDGWNASFGPSFTDQGYQLSHRNELIVSGCSVRAMLLADLDGEDAQIIIGGCASICSSWSNVDDGYLKNDSITEEVARNRNRKYCQAPLVATSMPRELQARWLYTGNHSTGQNHAPYPDNYTGSSAPYTDNYTTGLRNTFVAEEGWLDENRQLEVLHEVPLLLHWSVTRGLPQCHVDDSKCNEGVVSMLCKSNHSFIWVYYNPIGYTCHCEPDYEGNPYLDGGCQAIHSDYGLEIPPSEDNGCFFSQPGGCIKSTPGLIIGLSIASGPTLLLLVLVTILILRKIKQRRIQLLKQKYFMQNRGQLLQQLVSQKADIAERMIISVDELAKATNNFDKARVLGGGGHGTVYKGILSDLHVVAIKKSKIAVQKEIDEFINEVAILSQINHRNVVKLFGCCLETEVPLLVYEFISNGTLYQHLHVEGPRSLSWNNRLRIATEIATSLAYLHSAVSIPIIHRDIKSSNILLDDTLSSKVSDFGASRYIPIEKTGLTTGVQGTIGYLDPMYFYTSRLTEKSDVYSFGVIIVELLTRKKPFSYLSEEGNSLVAHFVDLLAEGNLVQIIDPQVREEGGAEVQEVAALAASCVDIRAEKRPTMRQVEHSLEGLWGTRKYKKEDTVEEEYVNQTGGQQIQESSRKYSLEQEIMLSSTYPR